jgi:hypothetical protein
VTYRGRGSGGRRHIHCILDLLGSLRFGSSIAENQRVQRLAGSFAEAIERWWVMQTRAMVEAEVDEASKIMVELQERRHDATVDIIRELTDQTPSTIKQQTKHRSTKQAPQEIGDGDDDDDDDDWC